jgi:hypothetical protein
MLAADGGCSSEFVREKRQCPADSVDLVAINATSTFHTVVAEPLIRVLLQKVANLFWIVHTPFPEYWILQSKLFIFIIFTIIRLVNANRLDSL